MDLRLMSNKWCVVAGCLAFLFGVPLMIGGVCGIIFLLGTLCDWIGAHSGSIDWGKTIFFGILGFIWLFFSALFGVKVYDDCRNRSVVSAPGELSK